MERVKEKPKHLMLKLVGIFLLVLAIVWGTLWFTRSEIRHHTGQESMERFLRFAQEVDAILAPYGIETEEYTTISAVDPNDAENRYAFLETCIPLEDGYQLYYSLEGSWERDKPYTEYVWCTLISPLKDSALETVIDIKSERFDFFFEVAAYLTNTYSAEQFKSRSSTQQRRLFRYVEEELEEVEGSYSGYDSETLCVENAEYEHYGYTCASEGHSWSYCLGVYTDVQCGVFQYKTQYYSTVEIMSDLNRF